MSTMIGKEQNGMKENGTGILPRLRGNDVQMKPCEMPELRESMHGPFVKQKNSIDREQSSIKVR